jgi:hypothetical protein
MEASTVTTTIALRSRLFSPEEEHALVGFLAGYSGLTWEAYALDLRQYLAWCTEHRLALFGARRADIEMFGRHLEEVGRARATIARRLCTIAAFYGYAEEEHLITASPAVHVRHPRLDYESHATGLDRNEVGALLVAAGLASARDHALISLLASTGYACPRPPARTSKPSGRTRTPHPDHRAQRRQDCHPAPRAPHRPRRRPRRRRTLRRADLVS